MASATATYDAALNAFAKSLPYLVTLTTLAYLPRLAHASLNMRRAQQVYDEQGPRAASPSDTTAQPAQPDETPKPNGKLAWLMQLIVALPLMAVFVLYFTPFLVSDGKMPWLAAVRSWIPSFLLCFFLVGPLFNMIARKEVASGYFHDVFYRTVQGKDGKNKQCRLVPTKIPGVTYSQQYEYSLLAQLVAVPFVTILLSSFVFGTWLDARLALLIPCAAWILSVRTLLPTPFVWRKGYTSFRGIVLIPLLFVVGLIAVTFVITIAIMSVMPKDKPRQPNDPSPTVRWEQDLPISQLMCLIAPLSAWLAPVFVPAATCILGYRYDAGERTTPTSEEKQMALLQSRAVETQMQTEMSEVSSAQAMLLTKSMPSTKSKSAMPVLADPAKTPIVLSVISLPKSAIRSTPTFTAGFTTLLVIHAAALLATLFNKLHGISNVGIPHVIRKRAESAAVMAMYDLQITYLAILIVPVSMLIAAERANKGGAKALWRYNECWACPDAEQTHEELALRPSEDGEQEPLLRA